MYHEARQKFSGKSRKVEINWEKRNNVNTRRKEFFMREAIAEAKKAEGLAEVPIGAVIVRQGKLLAAGII